MHAHASIKNLRQAVEELANQKHIEHRDLYAINHLIDCVELFAKGAATSEQLKIAIKDLDGALSLAMKDRKS